MEHFGFSFTDEDGLWEYEYWSTNGRCFRKVRWTHGDIVTIGKTRRISERDYISAWESYMDY